MDDYTPEDVEDAVIVALVRSPHKNFASSALQAELANVYEFPVLGRELNQALRTLKGQRIVRKSGQRWTLNLDALRMRPSP